jgi:S-adenosylmethionine hydrolase
MIVLFTDFGLAGPYVGQMKAVLAREAPGETVIDLFADIPAFDPRAAAYLLAAYSVDFPARTIFLCVVDPGVGAARAPVAVEADGRWYVGPDNGLFELVARRARQARWLEITWRPECLSPSFHGRDLFAPVAARLARGEPPPGEPRPGPSGPGADWPDDLPHVIYIDRFGNGMTGLRAASLADGTVLEVAGRRLTRVGTFSDVAAGAALWYENANGLAEIAVNQGRADRALGLGVGTPVTIHEPPAT